MPGASKLAEAADSAATPDVAVSKATAGGMLMLCGLAASPVYNEGRAHFRSDAWLLDASGNHWHPLTPSGTEPRGRALHATVLLPPTADGGARVAVFGGWCSPSGDMALRRGELPIYLNDVHLLTFEAGGIEGGLGCGWCQLQPMGPPPSPRAAVVGVPTAGGGRRPGSDFVSPAPHRRLTNFPPHCQLLILPHSTPRRNPPHGG